MGFCEKGRSSPKTGGMLADLEGLVSVVKGGMGGLSGKNRLAGSIINDLEEGMGLSKPKFFFNMANYSI